MASEKPKLKSILKRPNVFLTPSSQALRSGRATLRCVEDPEHVRSTEELMETLAQARYLREKTDSVLQNLKNFECRSPGGRAVSVEAAQKMLSEIKELNVKYLHEQKVLMERLRVKLEAFSTIGGMMSSLIQELENKRSELSEELQVYRGMRHHDLMEDEGHQVAVSKLHQWEENSLEERGYNGKTLREVISSLCEQFKLSLDDVRGQLEAVDALIASLKERSEQGQNLFLQKKEATKAHLEILKEALHKMKLDVENSTQHQIKSAQEAIQDCLVRNNDLISAKTYLETLESEVRALDSSIGDFSCAGKEVSCGKFTIIDRIQHLLELLKTVEIPEEQKNQLRIELDRFCKQLASTMAPAQSRSMIDEDIQTSLSGVRLSEAIKAHAAKLKRDRSRRRESSERKSSEGVRNPGSRTQ